MKVIYILCLALSAACLDARLGQLRQGTNSNLCPVVDPREYTIHLPHPRDCHMFLRCDHGIAKPERCPANLHFNPVLQVCDWPANAGCVKGLGTETFSGDSDSFDRETNPIRVEGDNSQPDEASQEQLIPDGGNPDGYIPNEWIQSGSIPTEDVQSGPAPGEEGTQNGQGLDADAQGGQTSGADVPVNELDDFYIQNGENQGEENNKTPILVDVLDEDIFPDANPE